MATLIWDYQVHTLIHSHCILVRAWVSSLLEPVGDEGPALVVESDDTLLLLLAQTQLDHIAAILVDRILTF